MCFDNIKIIGYVTKVTVSAFAYAHTAFTLHSIGDGYETINTFMRRFAH